jgi:hypothetical protein
MDWSQLTDNQLAIVGCLISLAGAWGLLKISHDTRPELRKSRVPVATSNPQDSSGRRAA